MKKVWSLFVLVAIVLASCGGNGDARPMDTIKSEIEAKEKKISALSTKIENADKMNAESDELVDLLLEFYRAYPEEPYSASCLSKVHMLYSRDGNATKAVAYADTLLMHYPNFPDRSQMIESQIQAYEMLIEPRNVAKIKSYLEMWLKENKNAPKEKIADMKYHLKFVDMSLEERMRMNMEVLD